MKNSMNELELSEAAEADLPALCEFVALVFNHEARLVRSWFDHWWTLNTSWNESIPRGWLLKAHKNKIIAFTSNIPLPYVIANQRGICYVTGTTGVHPNWRGKGLSKRVTRPFIEQKMPDLLVGTGSTPEAFKLWQSLGMISLPLKWPNCRLIVASHEELIKNAAMRRGAPKIIASGLGLFGRLRDEYLPGTRAVDTLEQVSRFETSDNEGILECRASDLSTYPLRDVCTTNWLYFSTSYLRKNRLVFAARSGLRLRGFVAFKIMGASLYLLECRCVGADPGVARDLLAFSVVRWRELGGTHLTIWPYTPMIKAALPRSRISSQEPMTYVYKANRAALLEHEWERTPGDGDIALF
jgi:hypothetical protein